MLGEVGGVFGGVKTDIHEGYCINNNGVRQSLFVNTLSQDAENIIGTFLALQICCVMAESHAMHNARPNTSIDDIAAVIGFTPTVQLVMWLGGANLYIPGSAVDGHFIGNVIGQPAFRALVSAYGCSEVWIPSECGGHLHKADLLKRTVADLLALGVNVDLVAQMLNVHKRLVQRVAMQARGSGVLDHLAARHTSGASVDDEAMSAQLAC